jgi:hypothetical protein
MDNINNTNTLYIFFKNVLYFGFAYFIWTKGLFKNLNHKLLEFSGLNENTETIQPPITKPSIPFENKYLEEFEKLEESNLTQEQVEGLVNNFIMDFTPVGNVIMQYDHKKESFLYYSDSVIPFRYLEPIGRKYVITFKCKQLFIDMQDEIEKSKQHTILVKSTKPMTTKDILTKMKTPSTTKQSLQPMFTKVHINRYTSMGRFSNFKMLKQVDRKVVDKNYSISFSDFKKMNANKTSL